MTPQRHAHAMEVFAAAVELPPGQRAAWLDEVCGSDGELRAEVDSLLAHDTEAPILQRPALPGAIDLADVADRADELPPLTGKVGRYEIVDLLGWGGMGVVYRARQETPQRTVALKLIRPGLATPAFRRRFHNEVETLARLRHPGIAAIYESGTARTTAGEQPYLAMEYVPGRPLLDYARERGLPVRARLELLVRLCEAIEHAHQRGVVHRDLKPANILVEEIDGRAQPRVLDFGVARLLDQPNAVTTLATQPGQLLGTLAYMSPEQVEGDPADVDTRADVYSLGVLGYELLAGRLPVEVARSSVFTAIRAVREQSPRPLSEHNRLFRGDLTTILGKALAKDKEQRYGSAAALAEDLRRFLAAQPILARPPSAWYVLRKFIQRRRAVFAVASLAVLALVLGILGTSYGLIQARQAEADVRQQFAEARQSAEFMAREIVANLDAISGTTEVRRTLLERLRRQVEDLLARKGNDPALLRAHAEILTRQSDIAAGERQLDTAIQLRGQALALRRRLAATHPGNREDQGELSIALVKIGDMRATQQEPATAQELYEEAYAIDQRLAATDPNSRHWLDNLAWSCDRLGHLALQQQRLDEAEQFFRQRLELNDRLLALAPGNPTTEHGIVEVHTLLAELALSRGDRATQQAHLRAALELSRGLLARQPHNRVYAVLHGWALLTQSESLIDGGDPDAALPGCDEAYQIGQTFAARDPTDAALQELMRHALQCAARIASERGERTVAEALAAQAGVPGAGSTDTGGAPVPSEVQDEAGADPEPNRATRGQAP
jgi:tRNA A-37 threonylcarbamoyl transferase component Bud32/tetratricopeptide (TPR) repeat protein